MKELAIKRDNVAVLQARRLTCYFVMCLVWKMIDFKNYFYMVTYMEPVKETNQERLGLTTFDKSVKLWMCLNMSVHQSSRLALDRTRCGSRPLPGGWAPLVVSQPPLFRDPILNQLSLTAPTKGHTGVLVNLVFGDSRFVHCSFLHCCIGYF